MIGSVWLTECDLDEFLQSLREFERVLERQAKLDAFLDAYAAYLKAGGPALWRQVEVLADELRRLDASFVF